KPEREIRALPKTVVITCVETPQDFPRFVPSRGTRSGNGRAKAGFFAQEREHLFYERIGCDAVFLPQNWNSAVLDKLIRPTDADDGRIDQLRVQMFHHRTAKTVVQNVIFDGAHDFDAAREKVER